MDLSQFPNRWNVTVVLENVTPIQLLRVYPRKQLDHFSYLTLDTRSSCADRHRTRIFKEINNVFTCKERPSRSPQMRTASKYVRNTDLPSVPPVHICSSSHLRSGAYATHTNVRDVRPVGACQIPSRNIRTPTPL